MTVKTESLTIGEPHWAQPRAARVVAARLLVVYPDTAVTDWYDSADLPGVTVTVTDKSPSVWDQAFAGYIADAGRPESVMTWSGDMTVHDLARAAKRHADAVEARNG